MPLFVWQNDTPVNPENLNKMAQAAAFATAASTFAGSAGRTITHNLGHTNYSVDVKPTADPDGTLGEVWVQKNSNTAVIFNSGAWRGAFDYTIVAGQ
jgi:hypothetical protein